MRNRLTVSEGNSQTTLVMVTRTGAIAGGEAKKKADVVIQISASSKRKKMAGQTLQPVKWKEKRSRHTGKATTRTRLLQSY